MTNKMAGFGYHGDFMTGWDPAFLQEAIETCTNDSGNIRDCPLFVNQGPLQNDQEQESCVFDVPAELANEDGTALALAALPGNVQIQVGPQSATAGGIGVDVPSMFSKATSWFGDVFGGGAAATTTSSIPTSVPAPAPTTSTPAATSAAMVAPGGAFIESSSSASAAPNFNILATQPAQTSTPLTSTPLPPTTTAAPVPTSEPGVSYEIVSTQTITKGQQVEEVIWKEPVVYVTEDSVSTVVVGGPGAKAARHLHGRHALRHRHNGRS